MCAVHASALWASVWIGYLVVLFVCHSKTRQAPHLSRLLLSPKPYCPHPPQSPPTSSSSVLTRWPPEFTPIHPSPPLLCTQPMPCLSPSRTSSQACKTRTGATTKRCVSVDHGVCVRQILMVLDNCRKTRSALSVSRRWTSPISTSSRVRAVTRYESEAHLEASVRSCIALLRFANSAGTTSSRTSTVAVQPVVASTRTRPSSSSP